MNGELIGIVGALGPYAGLDIVKKLFDQTIAEKDADHLPVLLISDPTEIPDRTEFLLGRQPINPAIQIVERLRMLDAAGARYAGIPCNTSHAPKIMDAIRNGMDSYGLKIQLINMIDEVVRHSKSQSKGECRPGILATLGTFKTGIYQNAFKAAGIETLLPSEETMKLVHQAINDRSFGIKSKSNPVTEQAREIVLAAIWELKSLGATSVVMGCTELPLAITESKVYGIPTLDSGLILARALIRKAAPGKLRPLADGHQS